MATTASVRRLGWTTALVMAAACGSLDSLLEVDVPSQIPADQFEVPANAALIVNSVVGEFECALTRFIVAGGLVGNELRDVQATGGPGTTWDLDRRTIAPVGYHAVDGCGGFRFGVYVPLSTTRWLADKVLTALQGWSDAEVPARAGLLPKAAAFAGYSTLLLGEAMCSASLDIGPELTRDQVFQRAEERFSQAITTATAAGDSPLLNLARVGRARARLNQAVRGGTVVNASKLAEAGADAALVPAGFVYNAAYVFPSERTENRVFGSINRQSLNAVEAGYRNLTWAGVPDPRVVAVDAVRRGADGINQAWEQRKYSGSNSPIPIARYAEARLIVAEAAVGAGNPQAATDIINALHQAAGIPPFAGGDAATVQAQIVEERKRELFLEGHHLFDIQKYGIPLYPDAGLAFQTAVGGSNKGGTYGTDTCLPLPDIERDNNPNLTRAGGR